MNCNHPVVRNIVLECLRYWVAEYHIDGFRFDLASILGRDQRGMPLANPPLLEMLAGDPVLANVKLVAEAWDAGGLYQVGSFPAYGRWAEWNGKYRDTLRRFLRGDEGMAWEAAERIQGSPDLYHTRGTSASINFITCHDGFSLMDLFSYNHKHNEANGEDNRDGANDNYSWNCGLEGETQRQDVNHLRRKHVRNAVALLLVSQGVPMILMGDEIGHTKWGNNNTYCHDNELNWLNWDQLDDNVDLFEFFQRMIAFRSAHPILRRRAHFAHRDIVQSGYPDISWHSTQAWQPNWSAWNRSIALMLCGRHSWDARQPDDYLYIAANMDRRAHRFELPALPHTLQWMVFADTDQPYPQTICVPGEEKPLIDGRSYKLAARSVVILVGKQLPQS
jgi:glycogen operon protein